MTIQKHEFTIYSNIKIEAKCIDCAAVFKGELAARLGMVDDVPGFELAVMQVIAGRPIGHVFAKIKLDSIGGVQMQKLTRPGTNPAGRN